jgi:hypothetical protein
VGVVTNRIGAHPCRLDFNGIRRFIAVVAFRTRQLDQQSGKIAHQTAQQLTRDGERVSFLVLIDTNSRDLAVEGRPLVSEAFHLRRKIRESSGLQDL